MEQVRRAPAGLRAFSRSLRLRSESVGRGCPGSFRHGVPKNRRLRAWNAFRCLVANQRLTYEDNGIQRCLRNVEGSVIRKVLA
jgi:hypothetical protein